MSSTRRQWYWPRQAIKLSWRGFHSDYYLLFAADLKHMATSGHFLIQNERSQSIKMIVNRFGRVSRQEC